ncbi:hypothetical protein SAMN05444156_0157 [Verrucomicrobium sp. GAS474]|uniref:hypothetical protein n=1 Tax=Verrucomicrobium sp. GAS474 TaxID=1882831 RepID=UPI00087B8EFB|nr:hypothetical protein [Verrucomicrobium sp. GAS474]SDT86236.1 hypothetical protein SAMN05444156_0157 [Verrucomicrobium sp. GAS474]
MSTPDQPTPQPIKPAPVTPPPTSAPKPTLPSPLAPPPSLPPRAAVPSTPAPISLTPPPTKAVPPPLPTPPPAALAKPEPVKPEPVKPEPVKPAPAPPAAVSPAPPKSRLPLPLLSRSRTTRETAASIPAGPSTPVPTPGLSTAEVPVSPAPVTPASAPKKKKRIPPIVSRILGWILAIALIGGLAYGAVYYLRQTQMQGIIVAPDYLLPEKVAIIRDFSGDISALRVEFRSARAPFERDLAEKELNLKRIASDLAVVEQRKKLYQQEADAANAEVAAILDRARNEADAVWKNTGGALDAEYQAKTDAFIQSLVDRAAAIKLPFTLNPDANPLRSPDVWANAFRLALYNPPAPIKPVAEREWLEKQLAEWHVYEKGYDERRTAIKAQAAAIRKAVSPKMDEIRVRVDKAAADVAAAEADAAPLRDELANAKVETEGARTRIVDQRASYVAQLQDIPKRNLIQSLPVDHRGRFRWEHLEANAQFPPGNYLLWVELKKDDQPYWAVVPFTIKEYQRLSLVLKPGAFVPALDLIK